MTAQFAPAGYPLEPAGGPTGVAERVGRPLVPQIALMRLLRLAARPAEVVIVIASVRLANRDVSVPIRSSVRPVSEGPRQLTNTAVSKKRVSSRFSGKRDRLDRVVGGRRRASMPIW